MTVAQLVDWCKQNGVSLDARLGVYDPQTDEYVMLEAWGQAGSDTVLLQEVQNDSV